MIRNLLYTCAATTHSEEWRLNVEKLCQYAPVFNGRKIISNRVGDGLHDPKIVQAAFAALGDDVLFCHIPNDMKRAETAGFMDALKMLESQNPNEITFHAQTRGVRYKKLAPPFMEAIRKWRNTAYDECLKDITRIDVVLSKAACCGCFLCFNQIAPGSKWCFCGSFWWFNHARLFTRIGWDKLPSDNIYGVEAYLGSIFTVDEAVGLNENVPTNKTSESGSEIGALNLYAAEMEFECKCGNRFKKIMHPRDVIPVICAKCRKRTGMSVEGILTYGLENYE